MPPFCLFSQNAMQFLRELYNKNIAAARRPIERESYARTGFRLAFEEGYFARRKALSAAALLYLTQGEEGDLAAACALTDGIAAEPVWTHPAHGDGVDLFCAETGFLLAELNALMPFDPARKRRVSEAVKRNVTDPFRTGRFGWEKGGGNWLAVCAGNVAGALFYEDGVAFSEQKARLKGALLRYLDGFPADGWCSEGLEYWNFGFGAFVRIAELCFPELLSHPKACAVAAYPQRCFLKGNVAAAFSDCPADGRADRGLVNFLSRRYGLPLLTEEETYIRAENCAWLPLSRGLRDGFATAKTHAPEGGVFGGSVAIAHRAAYSFAVKAGDNAEEHNHNDVGSFVVTAEGGQIVAELGQPMYDRDYFSAKRYENLAASSLGHSVPIVNGAGQCAGKKYGGALSADGLRVEFAGAYKNCKKLVRTFKLREKSVRVSDEFSADDVLTERFVCLSPAAVEKISSEEGLVPRVTEETYFTHGGAPAPVWLVDFDIPKGRSAAAFTVKIK